jgi:hypothetical protein
VDPIVIVTAAVTALAALGSSTSIVLKLKELRRRPHEARRQLEVQLPDGSRVEFTVSREASPHEVGEAVERVLAQAAKPDTAPPATTA